MLEGLARVSLPLIGADGEERLVGHHPGEPFLRYSAEHKGYLRNRQEITPYFFVPDRKRAGEIRVATLGASTMKTRPPDGAAWQLAVLLERGSEGQSLVINAGARGFGTARILGLQRELLRHDLDAVVVYTGHCELTESRLDGSPEQRGSGPYGPFSWLWSQSRLVSLLVSREATPSPPPRAGEDLQGIEIMDSTEQQRLLAGFRSRLEHLAADSVEAGVPAVWVLPASNLMWPPMASRLPEGTTAAERAALDQQLESLRQAAERGEAAASSTLQRLLDRYPGHAGVWFRQGSARLAAGDAAGALEALRNARDLDARPVRASTAVRLVLEEVARERGIALVDAEALLMAADPDRYIRGRFGNHPELLGRDAYRIIVEAIYGELTMHIQGLQSLDTLCEELPPRESPLPSLGTPPQQRGPSVEVDFHPPGQPPPGRARSPR